MRHPSLRWNRVVRSCGLVVDQKKFLRPLSVSMPRFCRRTWLGYLGGGKKETPGGEGREYTRDKCRCGEKQRASSRSNEEDAKGQKHPSLGESLANQLHSGSTHILHSAGGEMTSWRSRGQWRSDGVGHWPMDGRCLLNQQGEIRPLEVGEGRRGPGGRRRATVPHPTETRLAESIRGLCCIDRVLGHTARWEKARHIRGILRVYRVEKSINYLHVVSFLFLLPCLFILKRLSFLPSRIKVASLALCVSRPAGLASSVRWDARAPLLSKKKDQSIRTDDKILVVPDGREKGLEGEGEGGNGGTPHGGVDDNIRVSPQATPEPSQAD